MNLRCQPCTRTGKRCSFIPVQAIQLQSCSSSAIHRGQWSTSRPGRFTAKEQRCYPLNTKLGGPRPVWALWKSKEPFILIEDIPLCLNTKSISNLQITFCPCKESIHALLYYNPKVQPEHVIWTRQSNRLHPQSRLT
jgi:hypothetical protein